MFNENENNELRNRKQAILIEVKRQNFFVDAIVKLLSELEIPDVEELKVTRVGKILNKIVKGGTPGFIRNLETERLAASTMIKWKEYYAQKENDHERKRDIKQ